MGPKRGKITRAGKQFVLPVRASDVEVARDQELLNGISKNISVEEAEEAVGKIRQQREEELKRSVVDERDVKGSKRARRECQLLRFGNRMRGCSNRQQKAGRGH